MDLLGQDLKSACEDIANNQADTFAREITVIKEPIKTISNTSGNPLFGYPRDSEDVEFTPNTVNISGRILHGRPRDANLSDRTRYNDVAIDIPEGWVRLKIKSDDYEHLSEAKRIVVDGFDYIVDSHSRGHGLFSTNFYTFYLRPVNSD